MKIYFEIHKEQTEVTFLEGTKQIAKKSIASSNQTENLLPAINDVISGKKEKIDGIFINPISGSFTSLRVVFSIINSLSFALNIQPVIAGSIKQAMEEVKSKKFEEPILPEYSCEPKITAKKMDSN